MKKFKQITLFTKKIIEELRIYKCQKCKRLFKKSEGYLKKQISNNKKYQYFYCSKCEIKDVYRYKYGIEWEKGQKIRYKIQNNKCACCDVELNDIKLHPNQACTHHKKIDKEKKVICILCRECNMFEHLIKNNTKIKAMIKFDYNTGKKIINSKILNEFK